MTKDIQRGKITIKDYFWLKLMLGRGTNIGKNYRPLHAAGLLPAESTPPRVTVYWRKDWATLLVVVD
jgi:hypothetical protein